MTRVRGDPLLCEETGQERKVSFEAMSNVLTERIGLGTVQFGLEYGISNTVGRTPPEEVTAILRFAESVGVQVLDTAPAYGESERILGTCLSKNASSIRAVTKTPHLPENLSTEEKKRLFERTFRSSLQNLALEKIYGFWCIMLRIYSGPMECACGICSNRFAIRDSWKKSVFLFTMKQNYRKHSSCFLWNLSRSHSIFLISGCSKAVC
jgi:hypothetical protein